VLVVVVQSCGRCSRCQMVCVDQRTGQRTVEPLRSLTTMPQRNVSNTTVHSRLCRPCVGRVGGLVGNVLAINAQGPGSSLAAAQGNRFSDGQ